MTDPLTGLEPRELWARFDEIRRIPRPSKREERIREYVDSFAREHGLETRHDALGNVVVVVPATEGLEDAPIVVLQAHLDMVCEKNAGTDFDFETDAIQLARHGDVLTARGTTLGADNGVGVAAALRFVTDTSVPHGPLELLFTLDEETGLTGAKSLDASMITGRLMINLDSEEDGVITIGCAGGSDMSFRRPVSRREVPGERLTVTVFGGRGGHSGVQIHEGRANAIKVLVTALASLDGVAIVAIDGGNAHNAIPREARGDVVGDRRAIEARLETMRTSLAERFAASDPDIAIRVDAGTHDGRAWVADDQRDLVALLKALPHGELSRVPDLPELVETSNNLATVRTDPDGVSILTSARSSVSTALSALVDRQLALGREHGASAEAGVGYPPWPPDPRSPLLATATAVYERRYGEAPHVTAIHAGLECGIIGERLPGMDMISIGPTIEHPHSPSECVSVGSVEKMLGDYLSDLLETITRDGVG